MPKTREILVDRGNLRTSRVVETPFAPLHDGEVRVAIDRFALTANNVSYAISGDTIGYWKFYPADDPWGKVPVWGFGTVIASACPDMPVGKRFYGFYPMASHAVLRPVRIRPSGFTDGAAHRQDLPGLYNQYNDTDTEPEILNGMDDERCLLFPLFVTSYMLYDYLVDNDFFGAGQVLIGSASSKTGLGLAHMLSGDRAAAKRVVGLTSPSNVAFVESLGIYDQVVAYGGESEIDPMVPAAYVDMAGNGPLTTSLHVHLGGNMVESCQVGATHWDADRHLTNLPGAKPAFFFAPTQIGKRDAEWGSGVVMGKAFEASARVAKAITAQMAVDHIRGADSIQTLWTEMLENQVPPSRGLIMSLL
ncbi:MAG: DUF2855 family protein [Alphaproteobacteria bacterium]